MLQCSTAAACINTFESVIRLDCRLVTPQTYQHFYTSGICLRSNRSAIKDQEFCLIVNHNSQCPVELKRTNSSDKLARASLTGDLVPVVASTICEFAFSPPLLCPFSLASCKTIATPFVPWYFTPAKITKHQVLFAILETGQSKDHFG